MYVYVPSLSREVMGYDFTQNKHFKVSVPGLLDTKTMKRYKPTQVQKVNFIPTNVGQIIRQFSLDIFRPQLITISQYEIGGKTKQFISTYKVINDPNYVYLTIGYTEA